MRSAGRARVGIRTSPTAAGGWMNAIGVLRGSFDYTNGIVMSHIIS